MFDCRCDGGGGGRYWRNRRAVGAGGCFDLRDEAVGALSTRLFSVYSLGTGAERCDLCNLHKGV